MFIDGEEYCDYCPPGVQPLFCTEPPWPCRRHANSSGTAPNAAGLAVAAAAAGASSVFSGGRGDQPLTSVKDTGVGSATTN